MDADEDSRTENAAKLADLLTQMRPPPSAIDKLPCAYVIPVKQWSCPKAGTMFCAGCRLVAYCSKECQKCHWTTHKIDCKAELRSKAWTPIWVVEDRKPTFMSSSSQTTTATAYFNTLKEVPISMGLHLWGNIPAMDFLNLPAETTRQSDLNVASVASGDLRHIIMTVNALPDDFSGTLNVLLNDREAIIIARNIALLLLFTGNTQIGTGTPLDIALAAEIAVHYWASIYVPEESDFRLVFTLSNFLTTVLDAQPSAGRTSEDDEIKVDIPLGEKSRLKGSLSGMVLACLHEWGKRQPHDIHKTTEEMKRVRRAPTRQDRHHRHYCRLEPSHRVAFEEYRRFGLTLPFGARNDMFNTPNRLLFSPSGQWLQDDLAIPLKSWDIESVIQAGKIHGAPREDLYGCLYFFLSDTFRTFIDRLRRFSINFELFCSDASELSHRLHKTPSSSVASGPLTFSGGFDRIHVSNLVDENYCGISGVLNDWGPLLSDKKGSCILAYFMNWPVSQKGADWQSIPSGKTSGLMTRYIDEGKVPKIDSPTSPQEVKRLAGILTGYFSTLTAAMENSAFFNDYLQKHGLEAALKKAGLWRRDKHMVLPYRLGVPAGASNSIETLPTFLKDNERWYLNTCVGQWMWSERFVEFARDEQA